MKSFSGRAETPLSQEAILVDYTERLARHAAGRLAVHIHLSKLKAHNRREHHVRVAANTFETLVKPFEGQIFVLNNSDIVFLCKGATIAELDKAVLRLRYLFNEDPLLQEEDEAQQNFCTWYDMEREFPAFLALARNLLADEKRRRDEDAARRTMHQQIGQPALQPITPDQLAKVESAIVQADLSNVVRRQPVCAIVKDGAPQPVFKEIYVSIADLQRAVMPNINLASNRWLFQYLTAVLDRRVLMLLQRNNDDTALRSHFSLNLNVATLLSPEFLAFDNSLPTGSRGTIVIELQPVDIFADMGGYAFARDYLRDRGYRICIDGLSPMTLQFVDREQLGADLIKIHWSQDIADEVAAERRAKARDLVKRAGPARVILCRCDSDEAIRCGGDMGVSLFQGRYIDALLQQKLRATAQVNSIRDVRAAGQRAP